MTYEEYLKTSIWNNLRTIALGRAKHRCQVCNGRGSLEVHHRTYPKRWGEEKIPDLTVLCHRCHSLFTFAVQKAPKLELIGGKKKPGKLEPIQKRVAYLNRYFKNCIRYHSRPDESKIAEWNMFIELLGTWGYNLLQNGKIVRKKNDVVETEQKTPA